MKTINEFLDNTTQASLCQCVHNVKSNARTIAKIMESGLAENVLVIPLNKVKDLIDKIPLIVAHQIIFRKLEIRPLLDPWELVHFEQRRHWSENIAEYLQQFKVNPMDSDLISKIAIELSEPLCRAEDGSGKFIVTGTLITDPLFHRSIAMATRDVWGYNTFSGLFEDSEILDRMSNLDTAFNLQNFQSIIPVRVFSDFVEITDSLQIIKEINESNLSGSRPLLHGVDRDVEDLRNELENVVSQFVKKYSILQGERPGNFGKHLLNFYTMSPKDMIKRLGPGIICCPFEVPEDLKFKELLTKDWDSENTTYSDLNHCQMLVY